MKCTLLRGGLNCSSIFLSCSYRRANTGLNRVVRVSNHMQNKTTQQQAWMWHARRVSSVFSSEEASLADGRCAQSFSVVSATEPSTKSGDGMGVILDPCSPQEGSFASVTRAQSSRHPFASELRHKRATLETGAPNTWSEGGFCFASADTLKGSGGRVVGSSPNTSREGGSRFILASVDTSRECGGEEVESRSNTSGDVGSRFPFTSFSSVRGESKYSLLAGKQRDNRIALAKTTVGSSVSEETSTLMMM